MLYHAKNGRLKIGEATMDFVRFGTGERVLAILPGLGDGLQTVKGTALPMAWMYRVFAKDFTVYMFSRKDPLAPDYTTRDMARDLKVAMDMLGIKRASVLGVSMGGMIAQWFAVDYPEKVEKLILAVSAARPNRILTESIEEWIARAKACDHTGLMDSEILKIYSEKYYRKNKWMIPIMGKITKPESYDRFLIQADACLMHDAYDELEGIRAPTLVIGGEKDETLGGEASRETAARIPGAQLHMYAQWGHGLYEEAGDFNRLVLDFLK